MTEEEGDEKGGLQPSSLPHAKGANWIVWGLPLKPLLMCTFSLLPSFPLFLSLLIFLSWEVLKSFFHSSIHQLRFRLVLEAFPSNSRPCWLFLYWFLVMGRSTMPGKINHLLPYIVCFLWAGLCMVFLVARCVTGVCEVLSVSPSRVTGF